MKLSVKDLGYSPPKDKLELYAGRQNHKGFLSYQLMKQKWGWKEAEHEWSQAGLVPKVSSVGRMSPAGEFCSDSHPSCGKPTSPLRKVQGLHALHSKKGER